MKPADQYHVGIVVPDLDTALRELTDVFGYEWGTIIESTASVRFPDADREVSHRFAYSRDTPRLEVIQAVPGTLWEPIAGSGVHHLGYWSDDVDADVARLGEAGYLVEAQGITPEGTAYFSYSYKPGAERIELVSRAIEPSMRKMWE